MRDQICVSPGVTEDGVAIIEIEGDLYAITPADARRLAAALVEAAERAEQAAQARSLVLRRATTEHWPRGPRGETQ